MSTDFKYLSKSELFNLCQEGNIETSKSYTKVQLIDLLNGKELTKKTKKIYKYEFSCDFEGCDYSCNRKKSLKEHKQKHLSGKLKIRYDYKYLISYIKENNIELFGEYEEQKINRDTIIIGKCKGENCNENFEKNFRALKTLGGPYCKKCTDIFKNEKVKESTLKKYGVEYYFQTEDKKEKSKKTCLEKYGVEYSLQNKEVREKGKKTNLQKYGVENPNQTEQIREKIKQTNLERYGVSCSAQNKKVKEKGNQTNLERYGVKNPMQNSIIAEKLFKNRFKRKPFTFPSGKIVKVQGYEPFCLRDLIEQKIEEEDIVTDIKQVPEVWWEDDEKKKHRYYTDIYIKSQNKCIEVKSDYTFEKEKEEVLCKQQAVKNIGIDCEVWIYSKKGKLIEKLF